MTRYACDYHMMMPSLGIRLVTFCLTFSIHGSLAACCSERFATPRPLQVCLCGEIRYLDPPSLHNSVSDHLDKVLGSQGGIDND